MLDDVCKNPIKSPEPSCQAAINIQLVKHLVKAIQLRGVQLAGSTQIHCLGKGAFLAEANHGGHIAIGLRNLWPVHLFLCLDKEWCRLKKNDRQRYAS